MMPASATRGRCVPLLVALLLLGLAAAPADAPTATARAQRSPPAAAERDSQEGAATLRFVTFNAYHGGFGSAWTGDASHVDERLAIAADQLRALLPDVIALQEASAGRRRGDIAAKLAEALGFHHVRAPASRRAVPIPLVNDLAAWILDFDEGPAILSRFPIVASETYELPRVPRSAGGAARRGGDPARTPPRLLHPHLGPGLPGRARRGRRAHLA